MTLSSPQIAELVARQRSGWSLERPFYVSESLYEFEREGWLSRQWFVIAHCSEVAEPGAFIVRELLGESLLIVRDANGALNGFYNVCRHRGSRICDRDGRAGRAFTCPYHAWSYRLDGSLRTATALPEGVDTSQLGLRRVAVREIGGVLFASLRGDLRALDTVQSEFEPGLKFHGIPQARIAARRSYPTTGNWKLVLENFRECYHCYPAHPEYCSVMAWVDSIARVPADGGAALRTSIVEWGNGAADPRSPVGILEMGAGSSGGTNSVLTAHRLPIGGDNQTQSKDGKPVAPLMGELSRFDGGVTHFLFRPFVTLMALNDHAILFHFLPKSAQSTDVHVTWLVSGSASVAEVDVDRMVWLWDVTTIQDKELIERNAAGVRSLSYSPGPYTTLESRTAQFVERYLRELQS